MAAARPTVLRHPCALLILEGAPKFKGMLLALRIILVILVLFILPLAAHAAWWAMRDDVARDWGSADWSSAKLLPPAAQKAEAVVAIYAGRTGRWRGIFAHHSWIVVKEGE